MHSFRSVLQKDWQIALLALGSLPPVLLLEKRFAVCLWWMAALFVVLSTGGLFVKGRWRLFYGAAECLLTAAAFALSPYGGAWVLWLVPAMYIALAVYALPIGGWPAKKELPPNICIIFLIAYIIGQLFVLVPGNEIYRPAASALTGCFIAYAALWMLALNRQGLEESASKGRGVPEGMRRKNRLLTIGVLALTLVLAALPAIGRALARAWEMLLKAVAAILRWISSLLPETQSGSGMTGGSGMTSFAAEATEPGLIAQILEKLAIAAACIVFAVLCWMALKIVWKKLRRWLGRLWMWMGRYAAAASEDYVDEITDTRLLGETASAARRRTALRRHRRINEEKLTPAERIRYRYQRLLIRHAEWTNSSTARENLPKEAATIYERARYGGAEPQMGEAQAFAEQTKALEKR